MMEDMMMDPEMGDMGAGEMAEGGQSERRRSSRASSRSSSVRRKQNTRNNKKAPVCANNSQAKLRNQRAAAFKNIDNNATPRGSMKDDIPYENGNTSQTIEFDND